MRPTKRLSFLISTRYALLTVLLLSGCGDRETHVPRFGSTDQLVVLTVNGPTTFYEDAQGISSGLEYDLVTLFANRHGLRPKFLVVQDANQIVPLLQKQKAHFAAAGITINSGNESRLAFGPTYLKVTPQLVYNTEKTRPNSLADLSGKKIEYVKGSGLSALLTEKRQQIPLLNFGEVSMASADELIARVSSGQSDYVAALSNQVDIARNFYPNVDIAFNLGKPLEIAWAFPKSADPVLMSSVHEFFEQIRKDGTLNRLIDRYYGHIFRLEQADIVNFLDKMNSDLDHYRSYFEEAEELTGFDWRLLAALAYQESHWDAHATSPTGVRGMMMLTNDTADRLKVNDRLDPKQSILAGARYLQMLKDELPVEIKEPDRTWIALAAYNVGTGHIDDAMTLTRRLKSNPNSWVGLKNTLPLLSQAQYFGSLRHGFARGGEAVIMVGSVRSYYDILAKFKPAHVPGLSSLN